MNDIVDPDTIQLIEIVKKKCNHIDYGENKFKCIINMLTEFDILSSNMEINNIIIPHSNKIPISSLRYKTEYKQLSLIGYGGFGKVHFSYHVQTFEMIEALFLPIFERCNRQSCV